MKKFKITWGCGSVLGIDKIFKTKIVEANDIDSVDPLVILPKSMLKIVYYTRVIHTSGTKRNVDYGSYVNFIEIEEIKN